MKKLGFILLSVLVLTTGCFLSDDAKLASASEKLGKANNFTMNMKMDLKSTDDDVSMTIDIKALMNQKTNLMKMEGTFKMMGMDFDLTTYSVENNDKTTTTYTKNIFTDAWEKEITEDENEYEEAINSYNFVDDATKVVSLGKVDSVDMYEVTVDPEDLGTLLDGFKSTTEEGVVIEEPVVIKVGLKDGYIYSMEFDLTEYMEDTEDIESATLLITFTNINKTNVSIPQSVIDSAVFAE